MALSDCRHIYPKAYEKVLKKSSIALLQNYYNFFTLGLDMLTGKNAGDIIILNSEGVEFALSDESCRESRIIMGEA
ncbi:MAG: hypothetical protein ACM3XR_04435 [Bacillota bacterium]